MLSFQQTVVLWGIVGFDEFRVEDGHKVFQQHVGFYGSNLVVGLLLHVAVDDLLLLKGLEEFITRFAGFQGFVRELARIAVQELAERAYIFSNSRFSPLVSSSLMT